MQKIFFPSSIVSDKFSQFFQKKYALICFHFSFCKVSDFFRFINGNGGGRQDPRHSIRIVIWILLSDTDTDTGIGNSIKISANTETAMLSKAKGGCR